MSHLKEAAKTFDIAADIMNKHHESHQLVSVVHTDGGCTLTYRGGGDIVTVTIAVQEVAV